MLLNGYSVQIARGDVSGRSKEIFSALCCYPAQRSGELACSRDLVEIVLIGTNDAEEGLADIPQAKRIVVLRNVARNQFGTPLLNSVFELAREHASNDVLCFVNSDVVLFPDLLRTISIAKAWRWPWLMTGRRTTVHLGEGVVGSPYWQESVRKAAASRGVLDPPDYVDYFVYGRGMFRTVPPFAIGRAAYDNCLFGRLGKSADQLSTRPQPFK